jgi:dihydrofolate reductase
MPRVTSHVSISLDGFLAGPDQSEEAPLGIGGTRLHDWHIDADGPVHELDARLRDELSTPKGAVVMGRNMFGPVRGEWTTDWRGWWGDEPPYHAPVFVLTHYARDPVEMEGGTTFHFVTEGFEAALKQARDAAGPDDVAVVGGASTVRQALVAGAVDELLLSVVPVLLGDGERLFDGVRDLDLEPVEVVPSPHATHVRYRVRR